jgi:hypothetical protein
MQKKNLTLAVLTALTLTSSVVLANPSDGKGSVETIRLDSTERMNTTKQDLNKEDAVVVEVEACNVYDRLTNNEVKMIDENLFLDSSGNKVNPCSHDGFIYFKKVGLYENGKKLFQNSTNTILNRRTSDDAISFNFERPYTISYGDKELNIKDMNDFRKSANQAYLSGDKGIPTRVSVTQPEKESQFTDEELAQAFEYLAIPADTPFPEKFLNTPEAEKQKAVSEMYNNLKVKFNEIEGKSKAVADNYTLNDMVTYNRLIINDNHVVSQYEVPNGDPLKTPKPNNEQEGTEAVVSVKKPVNGASYYLFSKFREINTFVKMVEALVDEYATSPNIKLDDRLTFLNYILENGGQEIPQKAEKYGISKAEEWHNNIKDMSLLNKQGEAVFDNATPEDIQKYSELAIKANEAIRNNEYEVLPMQITNGQFKALSNIDKYKYAPQKNKHWTNKSVYFKNTWEQVEATTMNEK